VDGGPIVPTGLGTADLLVVSPGGCGVVQLGVWRAVGLGPSVEFWPFETTACGRIALVSLHP